MSTQQLTIPMFPLNIVLFPGETTTLHIFENRYKQLVSDCLENEAHFGIPYVNHKGIGKFGIEVKINRIVKTFDNGEMDVAIEGVRVFQLIEFSSVLTPKLYGAGLISYENIDNSKPSDILQELTRDYLWISQQSSTPIDAFDHADLYVIARLLDISSAEKYEILKAETTIEKEHILKSKIKLFTHLIKTESELKAKFILN